MKFFIILFLFVVSSPLFAEETVISDPKNVLTKVDDFLSRREFLEAFKCDSKAQFFSPVRSVQLACSEDGCIAGYQTDSSFESENTVSNCSTEAISIYGTDGKIWEISNLDFQSKNKNVVRLFLSRLSSFIGYEGDISIVSAEPTKYTLASGQSLEAMNVNFKFHLKGAPYSFQALVTVLKEGPGVAQMARFRLEMQTWFRLKQF